MDRAPSEPESFFCDYLPARFAAVAGGTAAGVTSVGSLTFRVPSVGEWTLRLREGSLEVTRGMEDDVMLQVTIPEPDFSVLLVEPAERLAARGVTPSPRGTSLRALGADPETARLVRHVPGSLLFKVKDGPEVRCMLVTPGRRAATFEGAACTIECGIDDFLGAQAGGVPPMQLFVAGKLRITGNPQIAMALAAVFG